jgi:Stealth protein CR2, conserved region 2/Stealth protein CR1, conserved region 1/Stealth protein CR3, conserved region 3
MAELFSHHPFEIDVVYTWVDGNDPDWRKTRLRHENKADGIARSQDATSDARWQDYGMLKYSLRTLHKNLPWVRKIFLATDNQRPDWLVEDERLTVVSHREFFADYVAMPTYNSHVIESQLHRIKGLSEHFIYLNDDVLMPRKLEKSDFFFTNGCAKIFPSSAQFRDEDDPGYLATDAAGAALKKMFEGRVWADLSRKMRHSAFALKKVVLEKMEREFMSEFSLLGQNRFRSVNDLAPLTQLFPYYAFLEGHAAPDMVKTGYVDIARPISVKHWIKLATMNDYFSFCINCSQGDEKWISRNGMVLSLILNRRFPQASPWEAPLQQGKSERVVK